MGTRSARAITFGVGAVTAFLARATGALALAGSGSSAFGGGGGGFSGGGSRGLGGGLGGYALGAGLGRHAGGLAIGFVILIIAIVLLVGVTSGVAAWRYRRIRRARVARVRLAALEAAENDPAFAPDVVDREARALFTSIEQAWSAGDRGRLGQLLGPDLLVEWQRRLDDLNRRGWRNRVDIMGEPTIEYVGLTNREQDRDDHVVVRITARMSDVILDGYGNTLLRNGSSSALTTMCEYWTLGKRDGHWRLVSIEQRAEGDHELAEELVTTPWSDGQRLQDASLVEQAVAQATPAGTDLGELASGDMTLAARAAALDLSLVDGRFAPDVLVAEVRRAVAAWTEAVDGSDSDLRQLASGRATRDLLHPGDASGQTRLVLRGARVRSTQIVALDPRAAPPTMTVEIAVTARRYIENRDTAAVLSGDQNHETTFHERWALSLSGDGEHPWRIVDAAAPAPV